MQTLIDQLNDGLNQDQPLSTLATQMITALQSQRAFADQRYQDWVRDSTDTASYSFTDRKSVV